VPSVPAPPMAHPVLKWAGGKRRLVEQYARHFPTRFNAYHEPFFGGGAVYFWLRGLGRLNARSCRLTDINPQLINFYQVLQSRSEELFPHLREHQDRHDESHYYQVRAQRPEELDEVARAARLLYLNRTCFNGLYRENSRGQFNVPMGRYKRPAIYQPEALSAASLALRDATLVCAPYLDVEQQVEAGDLVYLDPPYHPLNPTSSFTAYTQHDFSEADQVRLAELFHRLCDKGAKVLLSNSDAPLIRELYRGYQQVKIQAARAINSKADGRQKITELLIVGGKRRSPRRSKATSPVP
jgi:DNA adenine methylase